jgi:hypothetical protein
MPLEKRAHFANEKEMYSSSNWAQSAKLASYYLKNSPFVLNQYNQRRTIEPTITISANFLVNYHSSFAGYLPGSTKHGCLFLLGWLTSTLVRTQLQSREDPRSSSETITVRLSSLNGILFPFCASAEEAEILACLEGLWHLIHLSRWPAILESDCLPAVQDISSEAISKLASNQRSKRITKHLLRHRASQRWNTWATRRHMFWCK